MKINHDVTRQSTMGKTIKQFFSRKDIPGYIANRIGWHYLPRLYRTGKYPLHIDIEVSSYCQLKCPMCFRAYRSIASEGNMTFETFKKIIDEVSGKVYSLKFTGRGEPFMNKEFIRFLEYAATKKFGEIAIITNGQLLDQDMVERLIELGVDRVAFSIDGLKDVYEEVRAPIKYDEIIKVVTALHKTKAVKKRSLPIIRIQGVSTTIEEEKQFKSIWEPISDEILFLEYKDYSNEAEESVQGDYACPLLYQRMMIHWDGKVPMCINDEYEDSIMGNVRDDTVGSIWKGKIFNEAREVHRNGIRGERYVNCSRCALHREGHGK